MPISDCAPRIRRGLLLGLVFGMPTFFLYGVTYDAFNVPKLALLVGAVTLAGTIRISEWLLGRQDHAFGLLKIPALVTAVPLVVAWIFSPYLGWSLLGRYTRFEGLLPYLLIIVAAILIADAFMGRPEPVLRALVTAGGVVGTYALVQAVGLDPLALGELTDYPYSTIGHSNFLGGFLAITLPLSIGLASNAGARSWPWSLCAVGIGVGLILSFSQGGWGAAVAGLAVTVSCLTMRGWLRYAAVIGAGAVTVVMVGIVIVGIFVPTSPIVGGTTLTRSLLWETAVTMTADDPFTGGGPNVFAVEGTQHRSPLAAIYHGRARPDGPHSVPLAWAANTGLLGLGGFAIANWWWMRIGRRSLGPLQAGVVGALTAYLVQSLVSFDELLLGFVFWVLLASLAASLASGKIVDDRRAVSSAARLFAPALLVIPIAALWWATNFVLADTRFLTGMNAFRDRSISMGETNMDRTLAFRDDYYYRSLYAYELFKAAVRPSSPPSEQERLRNKAERMYSFLNHFPDVNSMADRAFWLHQSSLNRPIDAAASVEQLERARILDPYEIGLKIQTSDALLTLGSPDQAVATLVGAEQLLADHPPFGRAHSDFWGALAIAHELNGSHDEAEQALARAGQRVNHTDTRGTACHVLVAELLLGSVPKDQRGSVSSTAALNCPPAVFALTQR